MNKDSLSVIDAKSHFRLYGGDTSKIEIVIVQWSFCEIKIALLNMKSILCYIKRL